MEAQLYRSLYRHVMSVAHDRRRRRRARQQFHDRTIALVYLWSVLHDRPVSWACDLSNWHMETSSSSPALELPLELPSDSTMSRRLRTVGVLQLIERVIAAAAAELFPVPLVKQLDSKPLLVGAYSKDQDAHRGRVAAGQMARGYRLHLLSHGRAPGGPWHIGPMNDHDSTHAPALLTQLSGGGYVVADNAYDANELHELAAANNHQLLAPARPVNRGVRDAHHNGVARLRALDMLDSPLEHACGLPSDFGRALYNSREAIESCFGELAIMGLHSLPAWARGPRRVALWTGGKILLYLCRLAKKQRLMA